MSLSLEMLTKAADLVETQDKQRLRESPSPTSDTRKASNHVGEAKSRDARKPVENGKSQANGTAEARLHDHVSHNGTAHNNHSKESPPGADSARTMNNHNRKRSKDGEENSSLDRRLTDKGVLPNPVRYFQYHQRPVERDNGIQARGERGQRFEEISIARRSSERYQPAHHQSTSPSADRSGDTQPATKPMVLLQHPAATTLSEIGSAHTVPLTNPAMHHPYMYSFMYPAGTPFDPTLSALGRVPGSVLKDGEGQASSPNGSPNASIPPAASGMQFPAFMPPLANQALLMGARHPGTLADRYSATPLLLAQSSANQVSLTEHYKRILEGMQPIPITYSFQPQLMDQYLKSLTGQGFDGNKDALALSSLAGRIPPGSLAALQGQHAGTNELLMRFPELNAAMGLLRPQDRLSPRSASPYTARRRTESPVMTNGGKMAASYPFHPSLAQPQLNNLGGARTHAHSPANIFPQGHRSPATEVRNPEVERSGYRSHSRDLDRDGKPNTKDLASTSTSGNHIRSIDEQQLAAHSYTVTDHTGLKIVPPFYSVPSVHVPHGYPLGLSAHHPGSERSPSPHPRPSEDRSYHRPSRDRSPAAEMQNKKRSLESQFMARNSPLLNDRHSRPTSPATNGHIHGVRPQLPLVNGSAEAAAAELVKASQQHLLLSMNHTRSHNAGPFVGEGREQRSGSPSANPYMAAGMPYFNPQFLGGLTGTAAGSPLLLPQYAALAAKGADLASLYKAGENVPEYSRIAGLPSLAGLPLSLFTTPQLAGGRAPQVLPQDYAAVLQAHPYFTSPPGSKESGKMSPANAKDKIPGLPQQMHPSLLLQQPPQAHSPAKVNMKPKHSPSPQLQKPSHHSRAPESHSPPFVVGSGVLSSPEARRYQSPNTDRPGRESSPKPSSKPYRPNSMLRQHAEDLERSRKRKLEEKGGREEYYVQEKHHHLQSRPEQRDYLVKEARKDPKKRKQLISGEPDPDVEEHFRLSLGKDYKETCNKVSISGSVDDHFKKSLGDSWNKVRGAPGAVLVKSEARDSTAHTAHVLPTYSAAVASASQSVRGYPPHSDGKEPVARMFDPAYFAARDRYFTQNMPTQRKAEKSPPRAPGQLTSTVIYPPPPVGPVRQKVKAKAFIPEAPRVTADLTNNRSVRSTSMGSKGSSRTISGSSADSLSTGASKSPPVASPVSIAEGIPWPTLPLISSAIPFTFAHQQAVQSAAVSHSAALTGSPDGNSMPRHRNSPTSPRAPVPEDSTRNRNSPPQIFPTSTVKGQETGEGRQSPAGTPST